MASGVKSREITVGTDMVAEHGKVVVVHVRGFLNRGEECLNTYKQGGPWRIDLSKRDCIAGLLQGIEGMRVGGRRELIVSPHLAYGAEGVSGRIPPNAVIRFEVDLVEVREAGVFYAEDYPAGKHLLISHTGQAAQNLPRWQFGLQEGGSAGATITYPRPDSSWRHARTKTIELKLEDSAMAEIIHSAQATLDQFPNDCLRHDEVWSDPSEPGSVITRDHKSNSRCVYIKLSEKGANLWFYYLPETSAILKGSKFYQIISQALAPYLVVEEEVDRKTGKFVW